MHQHSLQLMIRQRLRDRTLPYNSIPRVWGGPGHGEICDACDGIVTKDEWVMEGIALAEGRKPLQPTSATSPGRRTRRAPSHRPGPTG